MPPVLFVDGEEGRILNETNASFPFTTHTSARSVITQHTHSHPHTHTHTHTCTHAHLAMHTHKCIPYKHTEYTDTHINTHTHANHTNMLSTNRITHTHIHTHTHTTKTCSVQTKTHTHTHIHPHTRLQEQPSVCDRHASGYKWSDRDKDWCHVAIRKQNGLVIPAIHHSGSAVSHSSRRRDTASGLGYHQPHKALMLLDQGLCNTSITEPKSCLVDKTLDKYND